MTQIPQVKKFDEKLCKLYQKQYNANILELDNADKNTVENICTAIMKLGPSSFTGLNHTLFQLMYNKFIIKNPPIFNNIQGPCSITLFQSKKYKKTIYVIGEKHCSKNFPKSELCPDSYITIADMLDTISKTTTTFLDIYVEFPPTVKYSSRAPTGFIGDIFREGSKCFSDRDQKIPACTTTRWHFSDVRFDNSYHQNTLFGVLYFDIGMQTLPQVRKLVHDESNFSWNILSEWCKINEKLLVKALNISFVKWNTIKLPGLEKFIVGLGISTKFFRRHKEKFVNMMIIIGILQKEDVQQIINIIRDKRFDELWKITNKMFMSKRYIKKEVDRSTITEYLINYNKTKFAKIIANLGESTASYAEKFLSSGDNTYKRLLYFESIARLLAYIASLQMDIYTLARIFKKFKVGKEEHQPIEPSNIITYAGNTHAECLRDFFTIGIPDFRKIYEVIGATCPGGYNKIKDKSESCCLNLKDFPQPFFSKEYSS